MGNLCSKANALNLPQGLADYAVEIIWRMRCCDTVLSVIPIFDQEDVQKALDLRALFSQCAMGKDRVYLRLVPNTKSIDDTRKAIDKVMYPNFPVGDMMENRLAWWREQEEEKREADMDAFWAPYAQNDLPMPGPRAD